MTAPSKPPTSFLFVVCQPGAEPALKKELAREHPELRFAYSRPGFVTFKTEERVLSANFGLRSVFARAYGLSTGKLGPAEIRLGRDRHGLEGDLSEKAARFCDGLSGSESPLIHVWERDRHRPGEEPLGFKAGDWQEAATGALREEAARRGLAVRINELPGAGEMVHDVVLVEEDEWWLGRHQNGPSHSPYPGGHPRLELPAEAPSRAYLKLEEGLLWSGAPVRRGDVAVEVGSAPGGASYALLRRGVRVVGIDPGKMDPRVLAFREFQHVERPVNAVMREALPPVVHWLLLDMNVKPSVALFAIDRLATRMQDTLLGVMFTVKLNEWKMADEIPSWLEHVKAMGMAKVRATQLPGNRQEIFVYGQTRKGTTRDRSRQVR